MQREQSVLRKRYNDKSFEDLSNMANILAVEDAATMRQVVNFTLTDAGHTVSEAANVDEALVQIEKERFDLIICDVNMPGKSGLELVKLLRARPASRFVPILMLTTEHREELKAQGRAAGATGWIVKPFDPSVLLDVVKKVMK
jgi:two-component system chemotaxis response regulator CheY